MPVQINEIVIRAVISGEGGGGGRQSAGGEADREAIVAECVEQIMEILKDKRER